MQEVLGKIDQLTVFLQEKISVNDKLTKDLSFKKEEAKSLEEKLDAKASNLAAMERIYKKYVDFDKEKIAFSKTMSDYNEDQSDIAKANKDLDKRRDEIKKDEEAIAQSQESFNRKVEAFEVRENEFKSKQKELKGMLTGTAVKEILK